ncbi:MAG: hypothetical protein HQK50_13050, partial [Oligoflexia bacterium]|nr:hypothetical protein [Oligoflexia bacterium]
RLEAANRALQDKSKCPANETDSTGNLICAIEPITKRFGCLQSKLIEWEEGVITPTIVCVKKMVNEMKGMAKTSDCRGSNPTLTCEQEEFGWSLATRYPWIN